MATLGKLNHFLFGLEGLTQANFIARLKQEQCNIRRMLIRIHTIRETSFIPSGYVIADTTTALLLLGLILSKIEPFVESLFFVSVITFLMRFLGLLIKDCDNPFGYYDGGSVEDISLKPVDDAIVAALRKFAAMSSAVRSPSACPALRTTVRVRAIDRTPCCADGKTVG